MKLYLAGPMTGVPQSNFPMFHAAEAYLRENRFEVVNPARLDEGPEPDKRDPDLPWNYYIERDIPYLLQCDGIALLPAWTGSVGACLEALIAALLGRTILELGQHPDGSWYLHDHPTRNEIRLAALQGLLERHAEPAPTLKLPPADPKEHPKESVCQEAERLINGPRQADYGHPFYDFTRTGRMWGAILGTADIPPQYVALCMTALKLSRQRNKPKRDNIVDAIGYLGTIEKIEQRIGEIQDTISNGLYPSTPQKAS